MGLIGTIIVSVVAAILGVWLILTGIHILLQILGWVLVIAAIVWVIQTIVTNSPTRR